MRTARLVLTPWLWRNSMISRICFASCHACAIRSRRLGPIPSTVCSSDGRLAMTTRTSAPKCPTSFLARIGPMPLTSPLPRYRSIPSAVVGGTVFRVMALNCRPCSLSLTHQPSAASHSPAVTDGREPTTVTSSRCPFTFTRRTQKPLSSLWNVTRSISPEICSVAGRRSGLAALMDGFILPRRALSGGKHREPDLGTAKKWAQMAKIAPAARRRLEAGATLAAWLPCGGLVTTFPRLFGPRWRVIIRAGHTARVRSLSRIHCVFPPISLRPQPRRLPLHNCNCAVQGCCSGEPVLERMPRAVREYWEEDTSLIYHHHQRGADELPHRGLKEFGSEQLPFKRFATNQAYYYLMLISFFLFESFKEDNLKDILPIHSYATTLRRKLVDLAAKVVRTGHEVILKVTQAAMDSLKLQILWRRCQNAVPIPLPS